MKKIEKAALFLKQHRQLFRCPVCQAAYTAVTDKSIICPNGHRLDLSKKGTLYFLRRAIAPEYDKEMLLCRRRILQAGLFDPFVNLIKTQLPAKATALDVGCGEGTTLNQMEDQLATAVGFDISTDGINLATQQVTKAFFCVADLAHLPFNEHTFDVIFNIFSPSNYQEFGRILRPAGKVIKVIPNADYLKELRRTLYAYDAQNKTYSNEAVLTHFKENYAKVTEKQVKYQFSLTPALSHDLLYMTPLHWHAKPERIQAVLAEPFSKITVDVTVLTGEK
ncbi:methyltransferase domain-containing protein [Loigolactobacillus backii]|uniref:methyltransferase domain-containing protein n=1 Tax=Loigolactobacillus backii TaxID=375175 RepID=UPI0007F05773|nr:methyltransferase domain-containing protein [Loigolactobacillus backii]ANK66556.1 23S rRNA methyltransferase [Loigolactobacillus backii]OLF70781.1 23S rRNA methyltransferase [Loigolactobacillus backii]PIO87267.1 23S rRNA methyltransferase [Loigolactobacillus backii]